MKGIYTILLLIVSNVFMTFAWYGHLSIRVKYRRIVSGLSVMEARLH